MARHVHWEIWARTSDDSHGLRDAAALAWVDTRLAEVQFHSAKLGTRRDNLSPIPHLPKDVLFQMLSWVALFHSPFASEEDSDRYPADQTMDLVHLTQTRELFQGAALERPEL